MVHCSERYGMRSSSAAMSGKRAVHWKTVGPVPSVWLQPASALPASRSTASRLPSRQASQARVAAARPPYP